MINSIQISRYQETLELFLYQDKIQKFFEDFLSSRLGKIWLAIPWGRLVKKFGGMYVNKGPAPYFNPKGKIALMILKSFTGLSDQQLIESLNSNIHHQLFCDIYLGEKKLRNYKLVSKIRCELGERLDIDKLQKELLSKWNPYIEEKDKVLIDATCYETDMRYPTDQKLLWESIEWSYKQIKLLTKYLKIRNPKTKYSEIKTAYLLYSRSRKKTYKKRKKITRRLLNLLEKLHPILEMLSKKEEVEIRKKDRKKIEIIGKILGEQKLIFSGEEVKNRIVSISKIYIRPIVRGKETKRVEFGAKVNKIQIGGIDIIEKIRFTNYNEGCNYKSSIEKAEELTGEQIKLSGADGIYATNENRSYAKRRGIQTNFKRKGRAGKHESQRKQLSSIINRERSTRLEGSFGTDKRHYNLGRIKARTELTEKLWIFFGIHTKNALKIGEKIYKEIIKTEHLKSA